MYLTILNYDAPKNQVITYELPSYAAKFECHDIEEYISHTLGYGLSNLDWQIHEELPQLVELHNQEYA